MKTKTLFAATVVIVALAACSSDDESGNGNLKNDAPVFSGVIDGTQTRATDKSWNADNQIGVTAGDGSTYFNVAYKVDAAGESRAFSPAGNASIKYSGETAETFTAYFPYSSNASITATAPNYRTASGTSDEIKTDATAQASPETIDFLWAKGVGSVANPKVNFVFRHMMSQITLNFMAGTLDNLNQLTYKLSGLVLEGSFNTLTGVAAAKSGGTATDISMTPTTTASTTEVSQSLIFFPQDQSEIALEVSVGGSSVLKTTLLLPSATSKQLLAGYNVKFDITLNDGVLMASAGTIIGWNTQSGELKGYGSYTADEAEVLDLAMSDGTFARVWDSNETTLASNIAALGDNLKHVVGIVYYIGKPTIDDKILAKEHPECTHGYILALNNIDKNTIIFMDYDDLVYDYQIMEGNITNPSSSDYEAISVNYNRSSNIIDGDNLVKRLGYNNTQVMRMYNYYYAWDDDKVNVIEKLDEYVSVNEAPKGSSGWFLPSVKDLMLVNGSVYTMEIQKEYNQKQVLDIDVLLGKLYSSNVSATSLVFRSSSISSAYWTSTEIVADLGGLVGIHNEVVIVDFAAGDDYNKVSFGDMDRTLGYYARAICAF